MKQEQNRKDTDSTTVRSLSDEALSSCSFEPFLFETPIHNREIIEQFGLLEDKRFICSMDLELTCWEDRELMKERPREIIEFGVSVMEVGEDGYRMQHRVSMLVRPVLFPTLSNYCKELTGITDDMLRDAPEFKEALKQLLKQLPDSRDCVWASWGKDPEYIEEEYQRTGGEGLLFDPRYINVAHFSKQRLGRKFGGLARSLKKLSLEAEEPVHRALPDAISQERVLTGFMLDPCDAMVSHSSSYRERLLLKKEEHIELFTERSGLERIEALKALEITGWNFQKAQAALHQVSHDVDPK